MPDSLDRRDFLGMAASAGAALGVAALPARAAVKGANERIRAGVMGTGGRGNGLAQTFARMPNLEVAYVCDVDRGHLEKAAGAVEKAGNKTPKTVTDFRNILDDKTIDLLVVATPNHWHAPAAILACGAGKHVYVEKPCSHNPREGELLVEAARKHKRLVQMGNQRRSWPKIMEGIQQVRDGVLGRPYFAQSWYLNNRPTIGKGKEATVPEGLNYALWQGPAPRRPFHTNFLPYNWHWFWHWGNELGNNGVHMIDLCRWGLGVDYPVGVTSSGGRFRYDDDQQTPDTHLVTYTFEGRKAITWEGLSCNQMPQGGQPAEVVFHGEKGSLAIHGGGYTLHDEKGKEIKKDTGPSSDPLHIGNLLDGIRSGKALNSEIEEGHKSTLLCHLGNIAYRLGRNLRCDPKTGHIDDKEAMQMWSREYEKGWEPKV